MKNWKPIAILVLFAVACGGTAQPGSNAAMKERDTQSVECSLSLPANSDAAAIQQAVESVIDGSLDPCQGALSNRKAYVASFERIDRGNDADPFLVLVFWMRLLHPGQPPYQVP